VTWSGAGLTGLGVLYFLITKLFAPRLRRKSTPPVNNTFTNSGKGEQNIAQGDGAIGKQVNTTSSTTQTVNGSGAAAQGDSTAAGAGGVAVGGDMHGNVYVNTKQPGSFSPDANSILPGEDAIFLHREDELAWLDKHLHPDKVVAICAPGGMGKTALAARALRSLPADRFPDPIIFHTFYHQPGTAQALQTIAHALQLPAEGDLEQQVVAALGSKQALLVLDGAEEADDLDAVLRLRGTCGVLITTRKRTDCGSLRLDLPPLPEDQAEEVLRAYSKVTGEEEAMQGIEKILGGWPVALRIAGHYLHSTGEPAADYLRWLKKRPFRKLRTGGEHQKDNAALLLERSVEQVSADAVQVLRLAGVLAFAPISLMSVMFVLSTEGEDQEELELRSMEAVNELVNYGLLERREEGLHIGHALIHEYAAGQLALGKEKLGRVAAFYIDWCKEQSVAGVPGYARMDGERVHCLRLIAACLERELWEEVKNLLEAIREYLDRQGWWAEGLTAREMCLIAVRQTNDRNDEGVLLNVLGRIYSVHGDPARALVYCGQSLKIRRETGDRKGEARVLNNIAKIYAVQGEYEHALQQYQQSLMIAREIGDRQGEGWTLNNLAKLEYAQGNFEAALTHLQESLLIRHEVSDKAGKGVTLNDIGLIYRAQGKTATALKYHQQAFVIWQKLGDKSGEAGTHWNIGLSYAEQGDLIQAERYLTLAVQLMETISDPAFEQCQKSLTRVRAKRHGV